MADPYASDPVRHRALVVRSEKPFNAETPAAILGEQLHTPNELFYVRHHLPVPHVKPEEYRLEVKGARSYRHSCRRLRLKAKLLRDGTHSSRQCTSGRCCE